MQDKENKPTEDKKTSKKATKNKQKFQRKFHRFLVPKSMKNLTKIDKKSTRREKNCHDEGQEGKDGHQEGKKRAKNENLRLQSDFEYPMFGDVGPAGRG